MYEKFWVIKLECTDALEDLGTVVGYTKIGYKDIWAGHMDWTHLAQDKIQKEALVNTAMNIHIV
jgi:hypothetical protein